MPRTRAARAKLAEEGAPLSPSQSLSNERRRRNRGARDDNTTHAPSQSPPDEDEDSTQTQTQASQDAATPPPEEILETRSTRRPTRKSKTRQTQTQSRTNRTDETQTQSRTYRTGAKKRKREQEPTIESILEAKIQKDKAERDQLRTQNPTPSDTDRERLRQAQIEETQNILKECRDSRANEPRRKRTRTKQVYDPYDEKGNFFLCRYKTVEYEIDDEPEKEQGLENTQEQTSGNSFTENIPPQQHEPTSTDDAAPIPAETIDAAPILTETTDIAPKSVQIYNEDEVPYKVVLLEEELPKEQPQAQTQTQTQAQTHAEPETPRTRGWGFPSIITSSVSKFIPFSSSRAAPAIAPSQAPTITPAQPPAQPEPQVLNEPPPPQRTTRKKRTTRKRIVQEEPGTSREWLHPGTPSEWAHIDDLIDDTSINGDDTPNPPATDTTPHRAVNRRRIPNPPATDTTSHQAVNGRHTPDPPATDTTSHQAVNGRHTPDPPATDTTSHQAVNGRHTPDPPATDTTSHQAVNGRHTPDPPATDTTPHQAVNGRHTPDPPATDTTPHQAAKPGEIQKLKEELEQELRTKIEAEYKAKALEESERLTAALSKKVKEVDEDGQRFYRERKKLAQHLDEIIPSNKRKRMPSPEVIPNPVGGGFGMDLDYFYISDEDSDEEHITPVRRPPPKKVRTSSHGRELMGSPSGNVGEASSTSQNGFQRTPSKQVTPTQGAQTGRASSVGTNLNGSLHRNVFEESLSPENDPDYAPNGPTMTFRVPSPTSSDDDDSLLEHESQHDITAPLSPLASKPTAPKQRPTPNYTTMPAPSHLVEIARKKALMHQPKTGSSLRNASRFSTSTTASDLGEDESRSAETTTEQQPRADETAERETTHQNHLTTHVDAYEEYMKGVSPKVAALMKETWTDVDTEMAEKAFDSELENFDEAELEAWINENYDALKAGQVAGVAA